MLKRFRVNNFKSLLNTEFHPVGVNVLIGPNNAGKTNLCSAIRFLGLTASQPLEESLRNALGETWNILNVYVTHDSAEFEMDCSLFQEGGAIDYHYELQIRALGGRKTGGFFVEKERLIVSG
ncbi:MAG: AAA family ATPase, partial [Candidatus Sumerlaeia bacterium]|nr:AAA family ATPase [Candidatus Sumerlaeia bacterium]